MNKLLQALLIECRDGSPLAIRLAWERVRNHRKRTKLANMMRVAQIDEEAIIALRVWEVFIRRPHDFAWRWNNRAIPF